MAQVLYKRDSEGEIRVWFAEAIGNTICPQSGKFHGKLTKAKPTIAKPKNVGKKNETTGEEQAIKEVAALYEKKIKEGYRYKIEEIDSIPNIFPMLAEKYEDHSDDLVFPVASQGKLDGFRCNTKVSGQWHGTVEGLFSRENEQFVSCPHIESVILPIAAKYGITFDGELYNHDLHDDFNQLQSLITKKNPTAEDLAATEKVVQYHIYDLVDDTRTFAERTTLLEKIFQDSPEITKYCVLVETVVLHTQEALDQVYEELLTNGYEGQMVRGIKSKYRRDKRSSDLLKRKEFVDNEFEIVEIYEGTGNRSGMAGGVTCRLPDGRTFGAGIKGGVKYYEQLWCDRNKYVGKMGTVKEFAKRTPDGLPRFPVFKAVREVI